MDTDLIASRIGDACRICENSSFPKFIGFFRPEETAIAEKSAKKLNCNYCFYGVFGVLFPDGNQKEERRGM